MCYWSPPLRGYLELIAVSVKVEQEEGAGLRPSTKWFELCGALGLPKNPNPVGRAGGAVAGWQCPFSSSLSCLVSDTRL